MNKQSYLKSKEGQLTLAFIAIFAAFVCILIGLNTDSDIICSIGMAVIVAAMLFSPCKVYIWDRVKGNK